MPKKVEKKPSIEKSVKELKKLYKVVEHPYDWGHILALRLGEDGVPSLLVVSNRDLERGTNLKLNRLIDGGLFLTEDGKLHDPSSLQEQKTSSERREERRKGREVTEKAAAKKKAERDDRIAKEKRAMEEEERSKKRKRQEDLASAEKTARENEGE